MSENDFGDIGALNPSISATSVIGAVNELYSSIAGSLSFNITDGSTTEAISNTQTITFASTANQVNAVVSATDTVTFSLPSDVTITGEFTAQGTGTHSLGTIQVAGNTISSSDADTITINDTLRATELETNTGLLLAKETTTGYPQILSTRGDKILLVDATPVFNTDIIFEGTANDFETTVTATDPTADRTITIPNETGTIVTTGSSGVVTGTMIDADTVGEANMANDAIGQDQLKNVVTLQILNSSGVVVKTLYGAGA